MNKLFKLIYVNLLGSFNINQIEVARADGVKSNLETKTIITGLIFIFYGYLIYQFFDKVSLQDNNLILGIGFFLSTIACLIINITNIDPLIFKSDDTEILFSMPVTRQQILFSKLFTIYIKNILAVLIIMTSTIISYISHVGKISDTFGLMYITSCLVIPFIPIVISSLIIYIDDYMKIKYNNNVKYKLSKLFIIIIILLITLLIILNINFKTLELAIGKIINCYIFTYLFTYSLEHSNIIVFITNITIPFLLLYLYYTIVSTNYLKICSMLKGVKKKIAFQYKKCNNMKRILGTTKKDLLSLIQNKVYLTSSYSSLIGFTFVLFFLLRAIDFEIFNKIPFFDLYFNTYLPPILATIVTFSNSSISTMSLEKDNIKMLSTMPIPLEKIILGKSLVNIIIGSIFIIINGLITVFLLDLEKIEILLCFLYPFISLIFITFTSIILDIRFIEKTQTDDNSIIKQRLINIVPMCLSIAIGIIPILFPLTEKYYFTLGSYLVAMLFLLIIEYFYYLIKRKTFIKNLLN